MSDLKNLRKARPVTAVTFSARGENGSLVCSASYAVGNGQALGAILLPAVKDKNGKWCLRSAGGQAIQKPEPADVTQTHVEVQHTGTGSVDLEAAWPGGDVADALLLLLHPQGLSVGDELWKYLDVMSFEVDGDRLRVQKVVADCLNDDAGGGGLDSGWVPRPQRRGSAVDEVDAVNAIVLEDRAAAQFSLAKAAAPSMAKPPPEVRFGLASCLYPAGMLDGSVRKRGKAFEKCDVGPAHASLWRLAGRCRSGLGLAAVILTGDQVYVDATAGLFDPKAMADGLRLAYARLEFNPIFSRLAKTSTPLLPLMDDHEVFDNWDGPDGGEGDEKLREAKQSFLKKQRSRWPSRPDGSLWDARKVDKFRFFFADTRTERERRTHYNWTSAGIFSPYQAAALRAWIADVVKEKEPAFVVSPAILVPRPLLLQGEPAMAMHVDAWSGFPSSFHDLLVCLYDASASNIVFLSGDEHLSCVASLAIREQGSAKEVKVWSVHSSALYAPFSFANAREEDFAVPEDFSFTVDGRSFSCTVEARFWKGDGFAVLTPMQDDAGRWTVQVEFDREDGANHTVTVPW